MFSLIANIQDSDVSLRSDTFTNSIWQLLFFIVVFIFILFLAIYVTRLVATSSYLKTHNKNIKLLEGIGIGYNNSIHLIQVGKKIILIGNTKESITFLLELEEDDIDILNSQDQVTISSSFKKYLNKYLNKDSYIKDAEGDNGGKYD